VNLTRPRLLQSAMCDKGDPNRCQMCTSKGTYSSFGCDTRIKIIFQFCRVPLFAFCVLCRIHGADLCSICTLIANYYDIQWDRFCRETVVVDHMFGMGQQRFG
jgi:hypothetical protein